MGNVGSNGGRGRGRGLQHHHRQQQQQHPSFPIPHRPTGGPQQAEVHGNQYLFAAATPYPNSYPNPHLQNHSAHPPYLHYNGYYPPPLPPPLLYDIQHQRSDGPALAGSAYSNRNHDNAGHAAHAPVPYVEHQKAVTIRNDVNLKKETLHMEPDEGNPGRFLVAFTFDATTAGRISVFFFGKEGSDCSLTSEKEGFEPVRVFFKEGLGQRFCQPSGTGIDFSSFEESELCKEGDMDVFPLAVKAEASLSDEDENQNMLNSQITKAIFEKKEKDVYEVRVIKQILWVNSTRYELQEIYGIGNSVDNDFDGSDQGKECVICLSEPRDTTVLPCRHMCMCSECAEVLRFQTNRCPICRQPVERLLEINVKSNSLEDS